MNRFFAVIMLSIICHMANGIILMSNADPNRLQKSRKAVERKLLSFVSTEKKNQQYEVARFQRLLNNYMHTLTQKQNTAKQFLDNLDEEDNEVEEKFIQARKAVKSMKDDALNEIDGTLSTLGIGLS